MISIFSPELKSAIARKVKGTFSAVAKWSGYDAGKPDRTRKSQNRSGSNPDTSLGQYERMQMMWNGEWLVKNVPFATNYILKRIMYCSGMIHYVPNTGDTGLDAELSSYLNEDAFKNGGIDCSFFDAYTRVADVETPMRGDALLIWYRDEDRLRVMEAGADQIGEMFTFVHPSVKNSYSGLNYFAGKYFSPNGITAGYKVYDRGYGEVYSNPKDYDAVNCIYFQDNIIRGSRGITKFHSAILTLSKGDALFQHGIDAAARQAKVQAIVFNRRGQAEELTYESLYRPGTEDGDVAFVERLGDGTFTEFHVTGDNYQVTRAESPGDALIEGCKHADEHSSLGLGFPYSFLVNARDIGGAPSRFELNIAGNEITRLRERVHRPRLDVCSYVFIMDAIARKKFRAYPNIDKGEWHFPPLPTADAFKDSQEEVKSVRAGQDSNTRVVARYGTTFREVLEDKKREAVAAAVAVNEANEELKKLGYAQTITANDILQISDNPQMQPLPQQQGGNPLPNDQKRLVAPNVTTKLSAYVGDVKASDLPSSVQDCISGIFGTNGETGDMHVIKYMMTPQELEPMADAHNLEAATEKAQRMTRKDAASAVHGDSEKHILILNNRVVDGHHHLAKALHGKVTKSLPVVDLTPARFQSEQAALAVAKLESFDPTKHPRGGKGTHEGGKFVKEGESGTPESKKEKPSKKSPEQKQVESDTKFESAMEGKSKLDQRAFRAARADGIAIPPAWTEVKYFGKDKGVVAEGRDEKGRKQRAENPEYRQNISNENNARIAKDLTPRIGELRDKLRTDAQAGNEEAKVLYLITQTGFRIGGKGDGKSKVEAFGASTLRGDHVTIQDGKATFDFLGKKGVRQLHEVSDPVILDMVSGAKKGEPIFKTNAEKVRAAWQDKYGGERVHDIRHVVATEIASEELDKRLASGRPKSDNEKLKLMKEVAKSAGAKLGNNPAQALGTYIDPKLWDKI